MSALPPAGWYDDPENFGYLRYWDGAVWTEHRSPTGGYGANSAGSGRFTDIGSWLQRVFADIWARRIPLLTFGGLLLVGWAFVALTAAWAIGDLAWVDGEWVGFSGSRVLFAVVVAVLFGLLSLVVYLALIHQMYSVRLGEDPTVGDSMFAGLRAAPKVIGWSLLLALVVIGALFVIALIAVLGGPLVVLAVFATLPLMIWLWVRYSFFVVAVVAPAHGLNPFAASAKISAGGRFWATFGRLLLLWIIGAAIGWALSIPFSAGLGPGQDFDNIIVVDDNDELVRFHVGDFLDEIGLGGGIVLLASAIPQLLNSLVVITGMSSLYAEIHGRADR